VPDKTISISTA